MKPTPRIKKRVAKKRGKVTRKKRGKVGRKKKRSPAQLRNDRRLGLLAKRMATAKRALKRQTKKKRPAGTLRKRQTRIQGAAQGRTRNPRRKEGYVLATLSSNNLKYHDGVSFKGNRANAAKYSLPIAKSIASRSGKRCVIAPNRASSKMLKAKLTGKA